MTGRGVVKVLDFGLAKQSGLYQAQDGYTITAHTEVGAILGTLAYMSPEQAEGGSEDTRSDIFRWRRSIRNAHGTARVPGGIARSPRWLQFCAAISPHQRDQTRRGARVEDLVRRGLRKNSEARFEVMEEVRATLEHLKAAARSADTRSVDQYGIDAMESP